MMKSLVVKFVKAYIIDELLDDYSKAIWDTLTRYEVAELLTGTDKQIIEYFFYL